MNTDFNWNATDFFRRLTECSKFAGENGYAFHPVSGLEGFHGALSNALKTKAFVCVSDSSDGSLEIDNTPHATRVKTIFLAYRHKAEDETARNAAMENMRELFRQFMSVLLQEKARLDEGCVYINPKITFTEIDRYFFTGAACAFFQISTETYTDLSFNPDEWTTSPLTQ